MYYIYLTVITIILLTLAVLCAKLFSRLCKKKAEKFEEVEYVGDHHETKEDDEEAGGDLHTARGGIIEM